ncbi:hypothetical protein M9434_005850 [Picochlorum sp. BPE23]|nr:hypothetical protein M9434_005850 [Picochlorum sp. BPE23]|eukprot:jgi/Picre1/30077/NNA_005448.t1
MKKAFTVSWLAAFVYALCTDALVNARTLQQTGRCSTSPGPRPEECAWEWERDDIECRDLANGAKLECWTEDGRTTRCYFEQRGMPDINFTCDIDADCQIQCQNSVLPNIPGDARGQVESILNSWVPTYDD